MKDAHLHFHAGNVIKTPGGDLWIVTHVNDDVISAVSFDTENCSATQNLDDYEREETCHCGEYPALDCPDCHGSCVVKRKIQGWRHSKIVAPTVREFIMRGVKRQFGL